MYVLESNLLVPHLFKNRNLCYIPAFVQVSTTAIIFSIAYQVKLCTVAYDLEKPCMMELPPNTCASYAKHMFLLSLFAKVL